MAGARGFVGSGVAALLRAGGHRPLLLDLGDDLRQVREVVIATAGRAGLLTIEHLHTRHQLNAARTSSRASAAAFAEAAANGYGERPTACHRMSQHALLHPRNVCDQRVRSSRELCAIPNRSPKGCDERLSACYRELYTARRWVVFFLTRGTSEIQGHLRDGDTRVRRSRPRAGGP